MVISTMMRMLPGIWLRIRLTETLEPAMTKVTARAMTITVSNLEVTAKAEQMPRICKPIGFLLNKGSSKTSLDLLIVLALPFLAC